ncbi:MAG: hypothetical protein KDD04_08930, partial [Sinomicrobium sp.]|nr:hypothetical protein [Sinomicrobium sp.]
EEPSGAGTYAVTSGENIISHISFNYNRDESALRYHSTDTLKNAATYASVPQLLTRIKNENNSTVLWKWFVIFALVLLIAEFLLLKFLK